MQRRYSTVSATEQQQSLARVLRLMDFRRASRTGARGGEEAPSGEGNGAHKRPLARRRSAQGGEESGEGPSRSGEDQEKNR
jgi:hypothetical protein